MSVQVGDQLEIEARERPRAAVSAAAAAVLPLAGGILIASASKNVPNELSSQLIFYAHHAASVFGASALTALGALALLLPLLLLQRATRLRKPKQADTRDLLDAARPLVIFAGVGFAAVQMANQVFFYSKARTFVTTGSQTYEQAKHLTEAGALAIVQYIGLAATLAIGFSYIIISLNAMRVGLLTRFMGVLGIIAGVVSVVPVFGSQLPIVQTFWLGALAYLLSGRWPQTGVPPAWSSGKAEPWPSQQELRKQRERQRAEKGSQRDEPEPEPVTAGGDAGRVSQKRKRKRRR